MRWWFPLLTLVALSGCLDGQDGARASSQHELRSFSASYAVSGIDHDGNAFEYEVTVELEAPRTIMDSFEHSRAAYPLTFIRTPGSSSADHFTVFLDGDLRVARSDRTCGIGFSANGEDCGTRRDVSFLEQGTLPPWGMLWPMAAPQGQADYVVHSLRTHHEIQDGGWWSLPDDSPYPVRSYFEPQDRFRYDSGPWAPSLIEGVSRFSGLNITAELVSVETGDVLPSIDRWPIVALDTLPVADAFPRLEERVFATQVTWQEALDHLSAMHPAFEEQMEAGCLSMLYAAPFQSSAFLGLAQSDGIRFAASTVVDGMTTDWTWRYAENEESKLPDIGLELSAKWSAGEPEQGMLVPFCVGRNDGGEGSMQSALTAAWRLPVLQDRGPCVVRLEANAYQNIFAGDLHGDSVINIGFATGAQDNQMPPSTSYYDHAAQSVVTGGWAMLRLPEQDMAQLDGGDWEPRPVPEASPLRAAQCVDSDPEGPVAQTITSHP